MTFADIHCHALCGVDDGARTEEMMYAMVDAAYLDGTRLICLTPHFHPGYYGDNREASSEAFARLKRYCDEKYADLRLYLANELHYSRDCRSWIDQGACRTINGSRYLLVDFSEIEEESKIARALDRLLNAGYIPVLAHAERYQKLSLGQIRVFRQKGVLIQLNTQSLFRSFGFRAKKQMKAILSEQLADFVSSDAHNLVQRPPMISRAYEYISQKYGKEYADSLCRDHAMTLLFPEG